MLLHLFVGNGICPNILRRGNNILLLEIKESKLRFLSSNTYVLGNEFSLINQFKLPLLQKFFPNKFLVEENLNYIGQIPSHDFFISQFRPANENDAILKYCKAYTNNLSNTWNLKEQLIETTERDVLILTMSMLTFLKQSFELQQILNSITNNEILKDRYLNPFNSPTCSIGSFVYNMFTVFFMNFLDLYIVQNEFGVHSKIVSRLEHQYVSFMEHQYKEKGFISAFNNDKGQKFFPLKPYDDDPNSRGTYVDLYSPFTKQVFHFQGCFFHHHCKNCKIYPERTPNMQHRNGQTFRELNETFENRQFQLLVQHSSSIDEVTIMWECQFLELKKQDPLKSYLNTYYPSAHPLKRLCPRDAVRGALFDTYAFKWSKELFPDEKCYFLDVNSLYSYCAVSMPYPLGKYKILIGDELNQLQLRNNLFYFQNDLIMGTILLTIVPPQHLLYPFLMYRKKDSSTINTLCKICAEKQLKICKHSKFDKSLTGTYFLNEIEYALELG